MHSKAIWNDLGEVMIGSANFENWGFHNNIEVCMRFIGGQSADILSSNFQKLKHASIRIH